MKLIILQYNFFVLAVTFIACTNTIHTSHNSNKRLLKIPCKIIAKQQYIQKLHTTEKNITRVFNLGISFITTVNVIVLCLHAHEVSTRAQSEKILKLERAACVFVTCCNVAAFLMRKDFKKGYTQCISQIEQEIDDLNAELTNLIKPTK